MSMRSIETNQVRMSQGTQILRPSKTKTLWLLLGAGVFVAGGVWMIRDGEWMGWFCVALFGFGLIAILINALPNSSFLELNPDGFRIRSLYREQSYKWTDVETFAVRVVGSNKMVAIDFSDQYPHQRRARNLVRAWFGSEGALPDTYGLSAQDLADKMNAAREHALGITDLSRPPATMAVGPLASGQEDARSREPGIPWNNWTHWALAVGALWHTVYLSELLKPHVGVMGVFALIMLPIVLVLSTLIIDSRPRLVVQLQLIAATWYLALSGLCFWLAATGYRPPGWTVALVFIMPGVVLCAGALPRLISLRGELERPF